MFETIAYRVIYTILLILLSCQNMNVNAKVLTLDSPPVFDGLIAAGGRLHLSTVDEKLICLASKTRTDSEGE